MQVKIGPNLYFLTLLVLFETCFCFLFWHFSLTEWCVTVTSVSSLSSVGTLWWWQLCDAGVVGLSLGDLLCAEICQTEALLRLI